MHELHLIRDLMEDLMHRAHLEKAVRVIKVTLVLGVFTEIDPSIFRSYFSENSTGSILEGAELDIRRSSRREIRLVSFDCE